MFVFQPSARAKLGMKAMKFLKKGKPVDDALTVEILVEAIRSVGGTAGRSSYNMDRFIPNYS